jgi:hypothetical protein
MSIRFTRTNSSTPEQRRDAYQSGLAELGDSILVWVNEADLVQAQLENRVTEFITGKPENLLPQFHELLREAFEADQAEDLFDVHSEDKESAAEWARLKAEAAKQKSKLITFIKENPEILPQVLSLTR